MFKDTAMTGLRKNEISGLDKDTWERTYTSHTEKLAMHRGQKPWQAPCMDDQDDLEAERIMSDVKNLEEEKQFYLYYQRQIDVGELERMEAEQERIERAETMREDAFVRTITK